MSESIRQSNLFAAEDYKKIFKAYQFIDYTAYDYDTLKQALLNYIQTYYPEDFNDYIESSEFIAIVELLAYFGTSLAFRTELNSRENFIDTAERRESIIRLAQMVNYVPRRNIPASGLFKIVAIQTDQPLTDADGVNLNDVTIYWNDPNNPDWFDQFIQITNAAFSTLNPFGRPTKSGTVGSIPTDLYQLNNVLKLNVTYPVTINVNGQQYPIDVCNPDFVTNETIFERHPDPANAFNFIYRNDSLGVGSDNTGFFLYFKQGSLLNIDTNFEFPVPNRVFPIDIQNINQTDVYVQETDEQGNVISKWTKVPALAGENIIYNSIKFSERNIFDAITGASDTISLRFADGNFGNVPTGLFRTWVRTSANEALIIRPDDAQGLQINIPYIGVDQQEYTLRIVFNLEQTIGNAAPSETDEQIKLRAPEVFSTQSRMVNGSDYNVLPLIYGNQIAKIQAIDRTYSGQSRYIDLNDPTGFHRDLIIFGQDGALFRDNQDVLTQIIEDSSNSATIESIMVNSIQELLRNPKVTNFFYDDYLPQFESKIRVNQSALPNDPGYSILDLNNPTQTQLYWKTVPVKFKNDTGYFANSTVTNAPAVALVNTFSPYDTTLGTYQAWGFISTGAVVEFANDLNPETLAATRNVATVNNVVQSGLPLSVDPSNPYAGVGPVELGLEEQINFKAMKVYPPFRNDLNSDEVDEIALRVQNGVSFWLYYDLLTNEWKTSTTTVPNINNLAQLPFEYPPQIVTPIYESSPGASNVTTTITVSTTAGLVAGMCVQVKAGTDGEFDNHTFVDTVLSGTTFSVTKPPIREFGPGTVVIAGNQREIYSSWAEYPASGIIYVAIATNNQTGITTYDLTGRGRVYVFESYRDVRFYWEPNTIVIDSATGQALQDTIEIMPLVNTNESVDNNLPVIMDPSTSFLKRQLEFNITGVYIQDDGYQDTSKVEVSLIDGNKDGIPDNPAGFNELVTPQDRIVFEFFNNEIAGYQSTRPWIANWGVELGDVSTPYYVYFPVDTSGGPNPTTLFMAPYITNIPAIDPLNPLATPNIKITFLNETDLVFVNNLAQMPLDTANPGLMTIANQVTAFFNYNDPGDPPPFAWLAGTGSVINKEDIVTTYFNNKSFLISSISPPGYGVYYTYEFLGNNNIVQYPTGQTISAIADKYHFDKNGKVFTQNTSVSEQERLPLYFKWSHYSPLDQRVDPSPTNIIDMIVITESYYRDMLIWKNSNGTLATFPKEPTTEELRIQFQDLNDYKMVSDSIVWNSGTFKILFGPQAEAELQATFKVVKAPSTNISDNEVKTKVIQAIDTYFNIRNWDFGEKFFYTELAAFIHQQLSKIISSIVIVPNNANSQFGNLFEIIASPTQLFMSTATVNNVQIVSNLTEQNLRA